MILVDSALQQREADGKPVRVGLVGAGYMGRGIALSFLTPLPGMRLVAVANRTLREAEAAVRDGGAHAWRRVDSAVALRQALDRGEVAVTEDPALLCASDRVDVVVEATGTVEFAAHVVVRAIEHGKHVVLMNAELDSTVGPILKARADAAGVVLTNTDGDEPGVAMNLVRFARGIGYEPVLAGNLKGLIDPYRTPETQREFAAKHGQKPGMITSFADGTKLSMEATILANAAGFRVGRRGMYGPRCEHVQDALRLFPPERFAEGGLVDYLLGAAPHTGAFVVAFHDHPVRRQYMRYFKMGDGPYYVFYTPYHLPHLQIASTVARAALFRDATVAPLGAPRCDVIAMAKRDLRAGETLDGIGGFTCYGTIENAPVSYRGRHLPMGLSEGCRVRRDIPKDHALTYDDVDLPQGRLADRLRSEQAARFAEALTA